MPHLLRLAACGLLLALAGCVAYPAYGPTYAAPGYGAPVYAAPVYGAPAYGAPVYVAPPEVVIGGGWGWHGGWRR